MSKRWRSDPRRAEQRAGRLDVRLDVRRRYPIPGWRIEVRSPEPTTATAVCIGENRGVADKCSDAVHASSGNATEGTA